MHARGSILVLTIPPQEIGTAHTCTTSSNVWLSLFQGFPSNDDQNSIYKAQRQAVACALKRVVYVGSAVNLL